MRIRVRVRATGSFLIEGISTTDELTVGDAKACLLKVQRVDDAIRIASITGVLRAVKRPEEVASVKDPLLRKRVDAAIPLKVGADDSTQGLRMSRLNSFFMHLTPDTVSNQRETFVPGMHSMICAGLVGSLSALYTLVLHSVRCPGSFGRELGTPVRRAARGGFRAGRRLARGARTKAVRTDGPRDR